MVKVQTKISKISLFKLKEAYNIVFIDLKMVRIVIQSHFGHVRLSMEINSIGKNLGNLYLLRKTTILKDMGSFFVKIYFKASPYCILYMDSIFTNIYTINFS